MIYTVYKIQCKVNDKVYYGRSQEVEKRWRSHKNSLRRGIHNNLNLQNDWDKHGEDSFIFEVIHETPYPKGAEDLEQFFIDTTANKYNIADAKQGGDVMTNNPRREETKKLKSKIFSGKGNPMYGKPKTQKMIDSVKEANSKPVEVDGVRYGSLKEASDKLGVKHTTVNYRLQSKSRKFENWKYIE